MIEVVHKAISRSRLKEIAAGQFGDFVKAVVDVDRGLINVRPSTGNRTRDVESPAIREKIVTIVRNLVQE